MAQVGKGVAEKHEDLDLIPGTHMVMKENQLS